MRERAEQDQVVEIQIVPPVNSQAERMGKLGRLDVACKAFAGTLRAVLECARIGFRIELDAVGPEARSPADG